MDDRSLASESGSTFDSEVLAAALSRALRDTLFSSGAMISPGRVQHIGREMSAVFLTFCGNQDTQQVELLGRKLALDSLGPRSILAMIEALRTLCGENANVLANSPVSAGLFSNATLVGYMAGREEMLLRTQERTHQAYVAALLKRQGEPNPPE